MGHSNTIVSLTSTISSRYGIFTDISRLLANHSYSLLQEILIGNSFSSSSTKSVLF